MQVSSKEVVATILKERKPKSLLDTPCGSGWLVDALGYSADIDGIDLYAEPRNGYRDVHAADLDHGIPDALPNYDCIVSCEGIEHFSNPGLFLESIHRHLNPGGMVLITTPNVWYPMARLQYFLRGFFPGFPCLAGRIEKGSHMHIMPWSYPQLYLYLTLHGFKNIQLHHEPLSRAKYQLEKLMALPQKLYCKSKIKKSDGELRKFWETCLEAPSLYSRHLIVSAEKS